MSAELKTLKVKKLADAEEVDFGPFSSYHPLVADGDTPVRRKVKRTHPSDLARETASPFRRVCGTAFGPPETVR